MFVPRRMATSWPPPPFFKDWRCRKSTARTSISSMPRIRWSSLFTPARRRIEMSGIRTALRWLRRAGPQPAILMYHRVTEIDIDPWGLAVTPENFAGHMAYLKRCRTPFPMSEFVERHAGGALPQDAVSVTFDDGYLDNLLHAKSPLGAEDVPATLFVVTGRLA